MVPTQPLLPAGLSSLGDKDIRASCYCFLGPLAAYHLLDPLDPGFVGLSDEVGGNAEVKRHRSGPKLQRRRERVLVEGPHRVVDRERPIRSSRRRAQAWTTRPR
jgi:hypothetical protein